MVDGGSGGTGGDGLWDGEEIPYACLVGILIFVKGFFALAWRRKKGGRANVAVRAGAVCECWMDDVHFALGHGFYFA